jgi:hypothetical protein
LLAASRGFYVEAQDKSKKALFLEQVDVCWLYCSDEVIRKAYVFLESVKTGAGTAEDERAACYCGFIVEIRKDLLKRSVARKTELTASDYRLYKAN